MLQSYIVICNSQEIKAGLIFICIAYVHVQLRASLSTVRTLDSLDPGTMDKHVHYAGIIKIAIYWYTAVWQHENNSRILKLRCWTVAINVNKQHAQVNFEMHKVSTTSLARKTSKCDLGDCSIRA